VIRSEQARMDRGLVQQKIDEYRSFLDTKIRPEAAIAKSVRMHVEREMQEYQELEDQVSKQSPEGSMRTVDLGWEKAYCEAIVSTAKIFVDVGMGFHVELTALEAADFCQKRLAFLQRKLQDRTAKLRKVENHATEVEEILDHLSNEASSLP
jgi:prefoldin alpha subunit